MKHSSLVSILKHVEGGGDGGKIGFGCIFIFGRKQFLRFLIIVIWLNVADSS